MRGMAAYLKTAKAACGRLLLWPYCGLLLLSGCGGGIWTRDLWVMSPTIQWLALYFQYITLP